MKKLVKLVFAFVLIWSLFGIAALFCDGQMLKSNMVRLHVVANSDTDEDQRIKYAVKDEIVSYLQGKMKDIPSVEKAKEYLQENLPQLTSIANMVLKQQGSTHQATVSLCKEAFDKRDYDTFSLPSGVYESLRVEIGNADGKNWWCVVFPSLCIPASSEGFKDAAVSSGFDEELTDTLSADEGYEIRFFILDCFGKIENFFFFR